MYIHTCVARRGVAWRKHDVVYSMILKTPLMHAACISGFLSKIMIKMRQWQSIVMYVTAGQICMWNNSGLGRSGGMFPQENF